MRVKLDENLPVELAGRFREAGHDAMTVLDQDPGNTAPDPVDADIELVVPTVTGTDEGSRRGPSRRLTGGIAEVPGGKARRGRHAAGGGRCRE